MSKYYIHDENGQKGPFSKEDLIQMNLQRDTQIWFEGLSDWSDASSIEELKDLFNASPPPYKKIVESNNIMTVERQEKLASYTKPRKSKQFYLYAFLIVVIIIGIVVYNTDDIMDRETNHYSTLFYEEPRVKTPEQLRMELLENERRYPNEYLKVTAFWRENLIGETVVEGKVHNSATVAGFKDVVIDIKFLTKTNAELQTVRKTIFEYVSANQSIDYKFKIFAPSGTKNVSVEIVSAKLQ